MSEYSEAMAAPVSHGGLTEAGLDEKLEAVVGLVMDPDTGWNLSEAIAHVLGSCDPSSCACARIGHARPGYGAVQDTAALDFQQRCPHGRTRASRIDNPCAPDMAACETGQPPPPWAWAGRDERRTSHDHGGERL